MSDLGELALRIPCAYCGAKPSEKCVTRITFARALSRPVAIKHYSPSGTATYPHTARTRPVWSIWQAGWNAAMSEEGGRR